jgi:CheY-like chemotaxis protein
MENQNNGQAVVKKILVVEDESSQRLALTNKLMNSGYEVLQAQDGAEGLESALRNQPHLILLDLEMPKMDGLTMLDTLRQDPWGRTAKVIILTNSSPDDEVVSKVTVDQPSFYLIKNDFTLDQLLEKITDVLTPYSENEVT